jgi:hypothetical protein
MSKHDVEIVLSGTADVIERIEAFILARFAEMTPFEHKTRMDLASLDPDTAKLFFIHHDGPNVIVEWPAGVDLLSIDRATLTQGLNP